MATLTARGLSASRVRQALGVLSQDVARLRSAIRPPFGVLVDLLAQAGLRLGEAFALRRGCADVERRELTVEESLSETGGRLSFGPTKTHQRRVVTLPVFLADDLRDHLAALPRRCTRPAVRGPHRESAPLQRVPSLDVAPGDARYGSGWRDAARPTGHVRFVGRRYRWRARGRQAPRPLAQQRDDAALRPACSGP